MIALEYQILVAVGLDLLLGDPRWFPHPVVLMGRLATRSERFIKCRARNMYLAGALIFFTVVGTTAGITLGSLYLAGRVHPLAEDLLSIFLLYTTLAIRGLMEHASRVFRALKQNDLPEARIRAGMMVGRDTGSLDETELTRATVESVAESLVDGITAPLFFAVIAGPVGAMVFKSISTLDSMFGYRNETHGKLGWVSARSDDGANYLPARLTALLIPAAALILGMKPMQSTKILIRDRKKHPSPNAGHAEAAAAGALGVQLGGLNHYSGQPSERPKLGDPLLPLEPHHIAGVNRLSLVTSGLALCLFLGLRILWINVTT